MSSSPAKLLLLRTSTSSCSAPLLRAFASCCATALPCALRRCCHLAASSGDVFVDSSSFSTSTVATTMCSRSGRRKLPTSNLVIASWHILLGPVLYIIAVGTGGTKPNISTMGEDQFDEFEPKERAHKLSFFNWWVSFYFGRYYFIQHCIGLHSRQRGLDPWLWDPHYLACLFSFGRYHFLPFLLGTSFYRDRLPSGNPLTRMLQVLVTA